MLGQVRNRSGYPVAEDFASALGSPLVQDTTTGIWYAFANGAVYPLTVLNAMGLGAKTDGSDSLAVIQAAITLLSALGGGVIYFPAGTYTFSSRLRLASNVTLQGAGMEVTKFVNTSSSSPGNIAIDARGVLGANYAISTPTEGSAIVTTTTANDSRNFAVGGLIGVSGDLYGQDYVPLWITTISAINFTTGAITLTEKLRRADLSKVHVVTSQVTNIVVKDLSISSTGDVGIIFKYARNARIERVYLGSGIGTAGGNIVGCREVTVMGCISDAGKSIDFHSTIDSFSQANVIRAGGVTAEGGCDSIAFIAPRIYGSTSYGIKFDTQTQRCQVLGGSIVNVGAGTFGVQIDGSAVVASGVAGYGGHEIVGLSVTGGNLGGNYGVAIAGNSSGNTVCASRFSDLGIGVSLANAVSTSLGPNQYTNCVTNYNTVIGALADPAPVAHFRTAGGQPTIAVGAGAGAGSALVSGTDAAGTILVTTGVGPIATAIVATITFANAYAAAPEVLIAPTDATTSALNGTAAIFVRRANTTTAKFEIWVGAAALATPVQYNFSYHVIQAS